MNCPNCGRTLHYVNGVTECYACQKYFREYGLMQTPDDPKTRVFVKRYDGGVTTLMWYPIVPNTATT